MGECSATHCSWVGSAADRPYSSFHKAVASGFYPPDRGGPRMNDLNAFPSDER